MLEVEFHVQLSRSWCPKKCEYMEIWEAEFYEFFKLKRLDTSSKNLALAFQN
jgi:hypothetical protein